MTHRGMIEKRVIDSEGTELGVVSKVEDDYIEISEGLFDELLLNKFRQFWQNNLNCKKISLLSKPN